MKVDEYHIKYHSISKKLSAVLWKQTSLKYSKICLFYWSRECESAAAEYFQMSCSLLAYPFLKDSNEITLSYTFFESKPGLQLPTYNPAVGLKR